MKSARDLTLDDILARKAAGRSKLARLTFGEKVKIVEEMRDRHAPFDAIRASRKRDAEDKGIDSSSRPAP